MYSFRHVFKQEPNAIREFIILLLSVSVMTGLVEVTAEAVAGVGAVVSSGLGLFYVRQMSVSKDALSELNGKTTKKRRVQSDTGKLSGQ